MQAPVHTDATNNQLNVSDPGQLIVAFEKFGKLSDQLEQSYKRFDERASELSGQLESAQEAGIRQVAEKEQIANQLEAVLNTMPAGVLLVDENGVIQTANPVAEFLLEQSLTSKRWKRVYSHCVSRQTDQELHLKSGRVLRLKKQALENHQGEVILLDDISEQRMLEDLANRQNRLAAMGQMAAALAHQLRTPLASAVLYASQLSHFSTTSNPQNKAVDKVRTSLRYLEKLINDMLMYAKGGEFAEQKFLLDELLVTFNTRVEHRLRESNSQLSIISQLNDFQLTGSLDALVSVLMNLAENAMEACVDEVCKIELEVYQQNEYLMLVMRDNGPGLSAAQQEKIFQPFYTQREKGTGLGLAVAQSIVQAHHGDLVVRSQPANGASFYVCLPLNRGEQFIASGQKKTFDSEINKISMNHKSATKTQSGSSEK